MASAHAAEFTWDTLDGNWSDGASWLGNAAPPADGSAELIFGGSGNSLYTAVNDLADPFSLHRLTFNSTAMPPSTIAGGALEFDEFGGNDPEIVQLGSGRMIIASDLIATGALTLTGTGSGMVTINGAISGNGGLNFTDGLWRLTNPASTYRGGTVIGPEAYVELISAAPGSQGVSVAGATASFLGNTSNHGTNGLVINGGQLKLTTVGGGELAIGSARPVAFGANGGVLDLTNSNEADPLAPGGNMAATGEFAITTTAGSGTAVIRFNGGQFGLSSNNPEQGEWMVAGNNLRFNSLTGAGALRFELTNGAQLRAGNGSTMLTSATTYPMAVTVRGVTGGDPTSGPDGTLNSAISRNVGRLLVTNNIVPAQGLTFEGAVQVQNGNAAFAIDGPITIAGAASGHAGYVAFGGRTTGTQLGPTIIAPGASAAGQNVLWLGVGGNDRLTIEDGGIAALDLRMRFDQPINNGVVLNTHTDIAAGGTLRFLQSQSNLSPTTGSAQNSLTANVGNHTVQGNLIGRGGSAADAVIDLYLPAGNFIPTAPLPNALPLGGVNFEPTSDLIVHGSGRGGLRMNGLSRPAALFGAGIETIGSSAKLDGVLTSARLAALTGSGGYLTLAAANETWFLPFGSEWAPGVPVGLRVTNNNPEGNDVSIAGLSSFAHAITIDSDAALAVGGAGLTFGTPTSSRQTVFSGTGSVTGPGPLRIARGATLAPGDDGIGQLAIQELALEGALEIETTAAGGDAVSITGNFALGPESFLRLPPGNTYAATDYTIATYSGTLTGTFAGIENLPPDYTLVHGSGTNDAIKLMFNPAVVRTWDGNVDGVWNASNLNWQGGVAYADDSDVRFDDTAAGTHLVAIDDAPVAPRRIIVDTSAGYTLSGSPDAAITGRAQLIKRGNGLLNLSGPNTYTGGTIIESGTLRIAADATLPDAGSITIQAGAILDLDGRTEVVGHADVAGSITAGTLSVGNLTIATSASIAANLIVAGSVAKTGNGEVTLGGSVDLAGEVRIVDVAAAPGVSLRFGGPVTNGGIGKIGLGTLLFDAISTYLSATHVNAGTVRAGGANFLAAGSLFTIVDGATLDLAGHSQTIGGLSGSGTVALGAGTLTLNQATDTHFDGHISGSGALIKGGPGSLELVSPQSFSGGLEINGGVVRLMTTAASGSGSVNVNLDGTLHSNASQSMAITLGGGTISSGIPVATQVYTSGNLQVTAASTVNLFDGANAFTNGEVSITGVLSGAGNIDVMAGPGVAGANSGPAFRLRNVTSPSTYTGRITVGQSAKLELRSNGTFSSGGQAQLEFIAGAHFGTGDGTYSQLTLRTAASANYGHDIEVTGTGAVNFDIGALTGGTDQAHQFNNLRLGGGQRILLNGGNATHTLAFDTVTLTSGIAEFAPIDPLFGTSGGKLALGAINELSPDSGLLMNGSGILTLAGVAAHTGRTLLENGTMVVSGSINGSSGIEVTGGELRLLGSIDNDTPATVIEGSLTGTGLAAGSVSIGDGSGEARSSLLSPAGVDTLGELSFGTLSLAAADAVLDLQIDSGTLASDFLEVAGTLTLGAGLAKLDLTDFGNTILLPPGAEFTIAHAEGGVTGHFAGLPDDTFFSINGRSFRISYDENDGRDIVLIPEPSSAAFLFGGLLTIVALMRRRNSGE